MDTLRLAVAGQAHAHVRGMVATGLQELTDDVDALDTGGLWFVVGTFEGRWTCARFSQLRRTRAGPTAAAWPGVPSAAWASSLQETPYVHAVEQVRGLIADGEVYQVNLCRVLSSPVLSEADLADLHARLSAGNPARYAARIFLPEAGIDLVSASPELFLRRDGEVLWSSPIKGTGRTAEDLTDKDVAENVMIVDLVRNDLGQVCRPGTVTVEDILSVEQLPGLVHLVSTVRGRLAPGTSWAHILGATFPPGSVSGAPKSTAVRTIRALEPTARGPYCGAIGWVDGDRHRAELAVGIRTFWRAHDRLHFGTGAGITWGSDPRREWLETELKAARLLRLATTEGER